METLESVTKSFSRVHLTTDEQEEIEVEESSFENISFDGKIVLFGKLHTTRQYNKTVLISHLKSLWECEGWVRFKDILNGLFLIQFEQEHDKRKVLKNSPWLFSKCLFLLKQPDDNIPRQQVRFQTVDFWVHLYGIPYLGFTEAMGRKIGAKLGTVLVVDKTRKMSWKGGTKGLGFMRVQIQVDIARKLMRGMFLKFADGEKQWIQFRYEKLPNFCYCCGKIGHVGKECSEGGKSRKGEEAYGDWLRAGSDARCPWLGSVYDQYSDEDAEFSGKTVVSDEDMGRKAADGQQGLRPTDQGGDTSGGKGKNLHCDRPPFTEEILQGENKGGNEEFMPELTRINDSQLGGGFDGQGNSMDVAGDANIADFGSSISMGGQGPLTDNWSGSENQCDKVSPAQHAEMGQGGVPEVGATGPDVSEPSLASMMLQKKVFVRRGARGVISAEKNRISNGAGSKRK